jgi:hypothetical protein
MLKYSIILTDFNNLKNIKRNVDIYVIYDLGSSIFLWIYFSPRLFNLEQFIPHNHIMVDAFFVMF